MHNCGECSYTTSRKYNLERHIKNVHKTPQNVPLAPQKVPLSPQNVPHIPQNVPDKTCTVCGKVFSRSDALRRHQNTNACCGTCDPLECPLCHKLLASKSSKCRHLKTCMGGTTHTSQTQVAENIVNGGTLIQNKNCITNTIHIHINNFGEENLSYLSQEFLEKCFETEFTGVKTLMDKIYFDDHHPENHNVRLTSLKNAIAEVYKDNEWIPRGLHDTIERMILKSVTLLTSTIANTTEATDKRIQTMGKLQGLRSKQKGKLIENTKGHLVARREKTK